MAAIKKPEDQKQDATIPVRVTKTLKAELNEMARDTGISTSERARQVLEPMVQQWKKSKPASTRAD